LWNSREAVKNEWFDYIDIGIERMSNLVNELLTSLEADNINLTVKNEPFDVSNIIEEAVQPIKAGTARKGIRLSLSIEPNIFINSDSERISQVLMILFDNAVKYTNDNGWIEVSLKRVKRNAVCSVSNSGEAIPQKDLLKIFDRFYKIDSSRNNNKNSFGLGLPIAKTIIEKLGGKISVSSDENGITAFIFTIPQ
jgi:signal transduction histidine kinase